MTSNKIGFWSATALVVGNMIGSGIFLLPASLALYGGISILGWLLSSLIAILLALIFGDLAKWNSKTTGGPYAYTRIELGEFPAFLVAWGYWISIWSTNAAIAVALVGYLGVFFPILISNVWAAIFTGLAFIWFFSWINSRQIQTVGLVQLMTTILKIIPILFIGLIGIFFINTAHFTPFNLSTETNWSAILSTTTLTFFAFLGMESAAIAGEQVDAPQKTIQRATILGTIATVFLYLLASTAIMGILPAELLAKSTSPFADAAELFWGTSAKYIVALGAIVSTMGALNGWILIQGTIPMAAAQDQLFPKIFKQKNKQGAPAIGIVLSSILASILMMLNYSDGLVEAFTFMMTLSTLSVITPYLFSTTSYALQLLRRKEQGMWKKLLIASFAFIFSLLIIVGCGQEVVFYGFLLLLLGLPFYVWLKK